MKGRRWTLTQKILCIALLNILCLFGLLLVFARSQFRIGPESLLLGPARDRILAIANAFTLEFESTPPSSREALLTAYNSRYHADFFLSDPRGDAIVGPDIPVTRELLDRMRTAAPPPRGGRRPEPPPRDEFAPPEREPRRPPREMAPEAVFMVITHNPTRYWAGARIPLSELGRPGILLLRTNSLFSTNLFFDWRLWGGIALSVITISVLCWLPFIRGLTSSIAQMDRVTEQIALGRFNAQVSDDRRDELGHLGEQINRLASRLQGFVKNQKRFLGDTAHELCAPIARIQFALGILEQHTAEEQRHHVTVLHEEIQEMSGLVNELLSFSRASLHAETVPLTSVNLAALVQKTAAREGATIETTIDPSLHVSANEALLQRALSNILRNAIRYAGAAGPIAISSAANEKEVTISIADSGPGLPASELEEVFAPFYRPEAARTRETGGAGLGLAIVRTCIEACRGTVTCRNRIPHGLEVIVRLQSA